MAKPHLRKPKGSTQSRNWQTVSCYGTAEYKQKLVDYSKQVNIDIGILVRRAMDAMYGHILGDIMESSVAEEYAQTDEESDHALIA